MSKKCPVCKESFEGRSDKIYCSVYCKSAHQYQQNKGKEATVFVNIDKQLKLNRRILKTFNKAGKAIVRQEVLAKEGFNPRYHTHYWKNNRGDVYFFCYEYGFMEKVEHDIKKYVLIIWQEYMG